MVVSAVEIATRKRLCQMSNVGWDLLLDWLLKGLTTQCQGARQVACPVRSLDLWAL